MSGPEPAGFSSSIEAASTPADKPAAVLVCEGDLDLASVDDFEESLAAAKGGTGVVVDLSGVRFIDSSGIHAIAKAQAGADRNGFELVVVADSAVDRVLEMSGLRERFNPRADRDAALAALDGGSGDR